MVSATNTRHWNPSTTTKPKGASMIPSKTQDKLHNEINAMGEKLGDMLDLIGNEVEIDSLTAQTNGDRVELSRIQAEEQRRWLAIARKNLQIGLDNARRAIDAPTLF
jgi:hypothetical protein